MELIKGKNFAFRLSGLYMLYLKTLSKDLEAKTPTAMMKEIISNYIKLQYGDETLKDIRRQYIEDTLER